MKEPIGRLAGIASPELDRLLDLLGEKKTDPAAIRIHAQELASTGDPIPENPFPPGSVRYAEWRAATLVAEEKHAELCAALMRDPGRSISTQEFTFATCAFPIWAFRGEGAIQSDTELKTFDTWLVEYADTFFARFSKYGSEESFHQKIEEALRRQLASAVQTFKGRARAALRRYEASHGGQKLVQSPALGPGEEVIRARLERVARYRKEHDLTWEAFARGIGMSESSIRGMIKGDRSRFGDSKLQLLLRALGVTVQVWDSPTE